MKGLLAILSVLILCSCATKTKIEYRDRIVDRYITKEVHDTLREHTSDSIFETIWFSIFWPVLIPLYLIHLYHNRKKEE